MFDPEIPVLKPLCAAAAMAVLMTGASSAQDEIVPPDYLDDRSTPQQVVRSFYNAISRHEYARAYQFLGEHAGADYEAFYDRYRDVIAATLSFGPPLADSRAGDIYYTLPVTVGLRHRDGVERFEAGCIGVPYQLPHDVEPPYRPMYISSLYLEPAPPGGAAALPVCE